MRKIFITLETGFCGSSGHEFYEVPDDTTDEELDQFCWDLACNHAAGYGIYPEEDRPDSPDEADEEDEWGTEYSHNIEGSWEPYDPEKHDGHTMGGTPHWQTL